MNVSPEVLDWVRKAEADPDFAQLQTVVEGLTKFAVIYRYPEEWSDEASASDSKDRAEQVRDLVRKKLGLTD
jgi:hypothetical protein